MPKTTTPKDGCTLFEAEFPGAADKIQRDTALAPSLKAMFFKHLGRFSGSNADDLRAWAEAFMNKHKLRGRVKKLSPDEILGRAQEMTSLRNLLKGEDDIASGSIDALLADLRAMTPKERITEVRAMFGTVNLSRFLVWGYRNPSNHHDPFAGIDIRMLPCRLGLPSARGKAKHLVFGFHMPARIRARSATAFDPGMRFLCDVWEPGGNTKPLTACSRESGLPEVVTEPVTFENVDSDFREATIL